MVQLKLWYKPKHRGKTQHRIRLLQDLYTALHYIGHTSRLNPVIKRVAVFSIRGLAPRPAPTSYTKGLKNPRTTTKGIEL